MLYSDKLKNWYGNNIRFKDIFIDSKTAVYIVETDNSIDVARVFHTDIGDKLEISIDRSIPKGDEFETAWRLVKYCMDKYDYLKERM
jgi:hypothetical protein